MYTVSVKDDPITNRASKIASRRVSTNGEVQVRLGAWVREELVDEFKKIAVGKQIDMSDVIRNAIQSFVSQSREESSTARGGKENKLARRIFRVLLTTMSPKDVLEDCLRLIPAHQVDQLIAKHRGEK
jgi:hypothetical protein